MKSAASLLLIAVSVGLGYILVGFLVPMGIGPSNTPIPASSKSTVATPPTESAPEGDGSVGTTEPTVVATETYLIWSTGGLTPELSAGLVAAFEKVSIVGGDVVELTTEQGIIPLDAVAVDPVAHQYFDKSGGLASLQPGTVLLGETSAKLRSESVGDILTLDQEGYEFVGVVTDETIGAAEIVFSKADSNSPVATDRFALVSTGLPRAAVEDLVRSLYEGPAPLRIRAAGETPWLRHGDAVLPQVFIKQALGEFSYTQRDGVGFVQNPEFLEEQIIEGDVPILGRVVCHRVVLEQLIGAMTQLVDEGLSHLVDPSGFRGCWNPRFIRSADGKQAGVSRHAWGAAVDLNVDGNRVGSSGTQDPRLIAVMRSWGFGWGGEWLVPDPMHFEYAG